MLHAQVLAPARSMILASGTLAPLASLQQQLFPHVPPERMRFFSCGHVVRHTAHLQLQPSSSITAACRCLHGSFYGGVLKEDKGDETGASSQVGQSTVEAECRASCSSQ